MAVNKHYIWILLLISSLFNNGYAQTFDFTFGSDEICQGSIIELTVEDIIPAVSSTYYYNWSILLPGDTDGTPDQLFDNDRNPGTGSGEGPDFSYVRLELTEAGTTEIFFQLPNGTIISQSINVVRLPVAGLGNTIFLCNTTGSIDLFDQIDGGPDTGGVWTYRDVNDGSIKIDTDGVFEIGADFNNPTDEPNIFTYTVIGASPCSDSNTTVSVKSCSETDYDNDGILNGVDLDNDNDGILDVDENAVCIIGGLALSPTQLSLDDDFGIGPPTQNRFVSSRLDYQGGIPQDTDSARNGQYNVATSTYLYNFNNEGAFYVATDLNNNEDGDGSQDGRYLAINMQTSSFLPTGDNVIYEQTNLPVTGGVDSVLSMKVVNFNGSDPSQKQPELRIEIVDDSDVVIAFVETGAVPANGDEWIEYPIPFKPALGVSVVTLRVLNLQDEIGGGNDVGIDNILLSRLECDFDGDGIPNYLDLDSDNDGIYDSVEAGFDPSEIDANGRLTGITNATNFGVPESTHTSDLSNFLNYDSDNDGCSDANEAYFDAEADGGDGEEYGGIPIDPTDIVDFEGRVLTASYLYPENIDFASIGNTELDFLQDGPDTDGDGISDACDEKANDNDNDGYADDVDLDDDNDGILDEIENVCNVINTVRTTGDYNVTVFEAASEIANAYATISGTTNSADISAIAGLANAGTFVYDEYSGTGNSLSINFAISERGQLGTDYGVSINDTSEEIALLFEKTLTADEAGVYDIIRNPFIRFEDDLNGNNDRALDNFGAIYLNGAQIYVSELNAFGEPNGIDVSNIDLSAGDVLAFLVYEIDYYTGDITEDPKTVLGYSIGGCDSDNDGIINQFDLDSDNDGIYDYVEAGEALGNGFENGLFSTIADVDTNGVPNAASGGLSAINTDGDTFYDFLDIDADGDGIPDNLEAQTRDGYRPPSGTDSDGNGVDDAYDGTSPIDPTLLNSDASAVVPAISDNIPDYLDENSDGDCIDDIDEAYDVDQDGVSDITPSLTDMDNDGLDDAFDSITLSGTTSYTNTLGDSGLISTFPNNHNPLTPEVDYRELYEEITIPITGDPAIEDTICEDSGLYKLFDLIEAFTSNENGLWTGGIASVAGESFDWELDPLLVPAGAGLVEYVYTLPVIGTCPESTFTVFIEVTEQPFAGDDNLLATVCETETGIVLFGLLGGVDITEDGVWSSNDVAATDLPTTFNGDLNLTNIATGTAVSFTYTVGANDCEDESIITLTKTEGRTAGTAPTDALVFCKNITDPTFLIDSLAGAEPDGTWNDGTVDLPDSLGTIVPSDLDAGDYTYTYTLDPTPTCEGTNVTIDFTILPVPDAGIDGTAEECSSTETIDLFNTLILTGTPDTMNSLGEEGVWTNATGQVIGTDHLGTLDISTVTTGDVFTYTVGTDNCNVTSEVTVNITPGPNPGTSVTTPIVLCKSDTDVVPLLITYLGPNADSGGTWEQEFNTVTSTNNGTIDLSMLDAGDYIFTYTLTGGTGPCAAISATVPVTITPELIATLIETDDILCKEPDGEVDLSIYIGGTSTPGGTWSGGVVTAAGILDFNTAAAGAETYVYTVESAIAGGCEPVSDSIVITLTEDRDAGDEPDTPIIVCSNENDQVSLFGKLSPGVDTDGIWTNSTGSWTGILEGAHLGIVANGADELIPGNYTFTYTLLGAGSCSNATVSVELEVLAAPVITFPIDPVCSIDKETYDVDYVSNDTWELTIAAKPGTGDIGDASVDVANSKIINIPAGVEIVLTAKDSSGVVCEESFDVTPSDCPCDVIPAPVSLGDILVCDGDINQTLSVSVDAGLSVNWYEVDPAGPTTLVASNTLSYTIPADVVDVTTYTYEAIAYDINAPKCESASTTILYTIRGTRPVDLEPQEFLCVDINGIALQNEPLVIESEGRLGFTYQWYDANGEIPGETDADIIVNSPGTYFVVYESTFANTVTGSACSVTSSTTIVTPVVEPSLLPLSLGTGGFSEFNSITATLENGGDPNSEYEYDLDGDIFQESNVFENVSTGFHTVTVTDLNGCGTDSEEIYVIGFPKFFTPNGDSTNEFWNVDLDPNMPMDLNIFIYDRFGKLIQQVFPDKAGWDGTFAGKNMPSDDYWFIATMNDTGETFASHFSLIR